MSRRILVLLVFLAVVSCGKEDIIAKRTEKKGTFEQAQELFDETKVPKLSISITPAEWNRLLHLYDEDNATHAYVQCKEVRIEDEDRSIVCHNVGMRLRGNTSRRRPEGWNGQDDNSSQSFPYDLKDDDPEAFAPARDQLKDFITRIIRLKGEDFKEWISRTMDVDLLLKMYAANVALGHWDDYWNNMNNYYLYFNSRDSQNYKVFMLPYDYDNTLGTSHNVGAQNDSGRQDPYHWGINECPLISKILEISEFRDKYTSYLRDFSSVDNPWTGQAESASRIRGWQSLIGPYVVNDTGEDMVIADKPASWGNHSEYRLLENNSNNWFKVKAESIRGWIK